MRMRMFLVSSLSAMEMLVLLLSALYLSMFFQKVLFLENLPKDKDRVIKKKAVSAFVVISLVLNIPYSEILTIIFRSMGAVIYDLSNTLFFAMIIFILLWVLIYSSYRGRKRAKWLAFFEWIPILGYFDGVMNLSSKISMEVQKVTEDVLWSFATSILLYGLFLLGLFFLSRSKSKFMRDLERDVENRSLTAWEELVVWIAGIWLLFSSEIIGTYIDNHSSEFVSTYVLILNMVVVASIVIFIIMSNYRDYYAKKNIALQKSLITTMADLVENRDESTGGHIHRTSKYVEIIAKRLQTENKYPELLTDKYIENMIIAAPLHDVGKIHIPDAILNKPGKLDDDEFSTMKSHAAKGGEIIDKVEESTGDMEYLKIAKEMAEYHHERMDGKGYPHGIGGDEIPLCAKILAVADVFDALISKRCYKDAMPLDKAFSIIEIETGDHFDKDVAMAFLDSREEIEQFVAMVE